MKDQGGINLTEEQQNVDKRQNELIRKIRNYLLIQNRRNPSEYKFEDFIEFDENLIGYCHGLSNIWLHYKINKLENIFFQNIIKILEWDGKESSLEDSKGNLSRKNELVEVFEDFISQINLIQHGIRAFHHNKPVMQDFTKYYGLIAAKGKEKSLKEVFKLGFIFKYNELQKLIRKFANPGVMIGIDNLTHAMAFTKIGKKYHFYNSNLNKFEVISDVSDNLIMNYLSSSSMENYEYYYPVIIKVMVNNKDKEIIKSIPSVDDVVNKILSERKFPKSKGYSYNYIKAESKFSEALIIIKQDHNIVSEAQNIAKMLKKICFVDKKGEPFEFEIFEKFWIQKINKRELTFKSKELLKFLQANARIQDSENMSLKKLSQEEVIDLELKLKSYKNTHIRLLESLNKYGFNKYLEKNLSKKTISNDLKSTLHKVVISWVQLSIKMGKLSILEYLLNKYKDVPLGIKEIILCFKEAKDPEILNLLLEKKVRVTFSEEEFQNGLAEIFGYLNQDMLNILQKHKKIKEKMSQLFRKANNNNKDELKWTTFFLLNAVKKHNKFAINYLLKNIMFNGLNEEEKLIILQYAIDSGDIEIVKLLKKELNVSKDLIKKDKNFYFYALASGNIHMVKFLETQYNSELKDILPAEFITSKDLYVQYNFKEYEKLHRETYSKIYKYCYDLSILESLIKKIENNDDVYFYHMRYAIFERNVNALGLLLKHYKKNIDLNKLYLYTCKYGDINALNVILSDSEFKLHDHDNLINKGFHEAIKGQNFQLAEYILKYAGLLKIKVSIINEKEKITKNLSKTYDFKDIVKTLIDNCNLYGIEDLVAVFLKNNNLKIGKKILTKVFKSPNNELFNLIIDNIPYTKDSLDLLHDNLKKTRIFALKIKDGNIKIVKSSSYNKKRVLDRNLFYYSRAKKIAKKYIKISSKLNKSVIKDKKSI